MLLYWTSLSSIVVIQFVLIETETTILIFVGKCIVCSFLLIFIFEPFFECIALKDHARPIGSSWRTAEECVGESQLANVIICSQRNGDTNAKQITKISYTLRNSKAALYDFIFRRVFFSFVATAALLLHSC